MEHTVPQTNLYFDQDITLSEMLKVIEVERLRSVLGHLLGPGFRLLMPDDKVMLGGVAALADAMRVPFKFELEPIGYLESASSEGLTAAVQLMEILVQSTARYFMAAAIQMESVQQDYTELQEKNTQLQASEERYRQLAANLEQRVNEQVKTIEATQRQLYQTEKLASVGQLAAGMAHEINNPLCFIKSNLSSADGYVASVGRFGALLNAGQDAALLRSAWKREQIDQLLEDFSALLRECNDGVVRVANIVSALTDFSSVDRAEEAAVDINALIENTSRIVAGEFGTRINLVHDFRELPMLHCHSGRLSQVFLSILLNAVQAIPERGEIRIDTSSDGQDMHVRISDTGKGIPESIQSRIFEPFYTTHDVGQGTGLGLTMARDVVQAHGGRIEVHSQVGMGTTFSLILPLSTEKTRA